MLSHEMHHLLRLCLWNPCRTPLEGQNLRSFRLYSPKCIIKDRSNYETRLISRALYQFGKLQNWELKVNENSFELLFVKFI